MNAKVEWNTTLRRLIFNFEHRLDSLLPATGAKIVRYAKYRLVPARIQLIFTLGTQLYTSELLTRICQAVVEVFWQATTSGDEDELPVIRPYAFTMHWEDTCVVVEFLVPQDWPELHDVAERCDTLHELVSGLRMVSEPDVHLLNKDIEWEATSAFKHGDSALRQIVVATEVPDEDDDGLDNT